MYAEEMHRAGAPGTLNPLGLSNIAPAIIEHGTDEQKRTLLPRMLRGDDIWCQGFSEPERGLRPRVAAHVGRARRRRVDRQRPEDVEHARQPRELVRAPRAHRPRRAQAPGHHLPARRHDAAGRRGPAAHHDHRRAASSTRSSSPTCASRSTARSAPVDDGWRVAMTTLAYERGTVAKLHLGTRAEDPAPHRRRAQRRRSATAASRPTTRCCATSSHACTSKASC